jgi:hypothetical protein
MIVGAKQRLRRRAAALLLGDQKPAGRQGQKEHRQYPRRGEEHQLRPEGGGQVGGIDIIKVHQGHKHLEGHGVHAGHLLLPDQADALGEIAHGHHEKHGEDGVDAHEKAVHDIFAFYVSE